MSAAAPRSSVVSTLQRFNVSISSRQQVRAVDLRLLRRIVATLLNEMSLSQAELAIHLVSATDITRLNESFLHHAGSTDVITFNYSTQPIALPLSLRPEPIVPRSRRAKASRFEGLSRPLTRPENTLLPTRAEGKDERAGFTGSMLCGEIFVCVEEAVSQARRFRTTWPSELVRYSVHGILHLLGFDDLTPSTRDQMKRAEDRWLRKLSRRFPLTRLARRCAAR